MFVIIMLINIIIYFMDENKKINYILTKKNNEWGVEFIYHKLHYFSLP